MFGYGLPGTGAGTGAAAAGPAGRTDHRNRGRGAAGSQRGCPSRGGAQHAGRCHLAWHAAWPPQEHQPAASGAGPRSQPRWLSCSRYLIVAINGDPAGPFFAVGGGGIGGTCAPKSVSPAKRSLHVAGVESFPPGPHGGDLLCAPLGGQIVLEYSCWWFDQTTAGYVSGVGYASSLADAAAKTNQIRASVEH